MIQHIVLFTPKPGIPEENRRSFASLVNSTLSSSPYVSRFTIGRRVDVDPGYSRNFGDKTYEYAAVIEFDSKDRLIAYLIDSNHDRLGQLFWEYCESCVVCEVDIS